MSYSGIDDYQILNYILGQGSEAEREKVLAWLSESEENRKTYFQLKALWAAYNDNYFDDKDNFERSLEKFRAKINKPEKRSPLFLSIAKYAAILLVTLGSASLLWYALLRHEEETITVLVGKNDQIQTAVLSDNTRVWINKNSKLTYPVSFNKKNRIVQIEGEAYFEVKKDRAHPFIVQTSSVSVVVTGTSFNVKSFPVQKITETTLAEGSVSLQEKNGKSIAVLTPGDRVRFDKKKNKLTKDKVEAGLYTEWHLGATLLNNVNINDIARGIEKLYKLKVEVDNKDIDLKRFNFTIHKGQPIDTVMEMLKYIAPVKYKIEGDRVYIKKK